jgi:hypothetical protein
LKAATGGALLRRGLAFAGVEAATGNRGEGARILPDAMFDRSRIPANRAAAIAQLQEAAARARRLSSEFCHDPIAPGLLRYADEQERRAAGIRRLCSAALGDMLGAGRRRSAA